MIPVILSGGVGSRLWPLSRGMYPKQLLSLVDDEKTMLQLTVERVSAICNMDALTIVCNNEHRFMVAEQLSNIVNSPPSILLEPQGKNTAPAIALAAFHALKHFDDEMMVVMPADHVIGDVASFHRAIESAVVQAEQGRLVTFGITPLKPETAYGYIKSGAMLDQHAFKIAQFKEKPEIETAKTYLQSGDYFWNSGIFVFKPSVYLQELKLYAREIHDVCHKAYDASVKDLDFIRIDQALFSTTPSDSIDYAVMEKTKKSAVVPMDPQWNDIGSWSALWDVAQKDQNQNVIQGDVITQDTTDSYLYSNSKLVATLGLKDMVVVDTDDVILVASKDHLDDIKQIVSELSKQGRTQTQHHRKVFRPWGWYDAIDVGENFQVKRIGVKPGARLSVQMHHHRVEHWVVVSGVAEVLNGDQTFNLRENESTYIPIGTKHSLKNPAADTFLEIIEIQTGSYLGEDDIVRFEDNYGRS
ncbi:MAG: mannose-1-phosphate guanylyltransferase/mannose-6-phosphate isomerase [Thalassolituus oleivorans]|jgi:mannose-1-phosphate guanylyltransferase/mannose-6-phosphate isomerase